MSWWQAPQKGTIRLCHTVYCITSPSLALELPSCSGPYPWTGNDQVAKSGCTLDMEGMWLTAEAVATIWLLVLAT